MQHGAEHTVGEPRRRGRQRFQTESLLEADAHDVHPEEEGQSQAAEKRGPGGSRADAPRLPSGKMPYGLPICKMPYDLPHKVTSDCLTC